MQQNSSIFNFKRFLLKILIPFLILSITIGLVINYAFERTIILGSEISGAYKVNRIINSTDITEIPIFGSSRAEGGIIPDSIVKNGFNYGISGTQDNVLLFFLKEECKKNKKTPIIINMDLHGFSYVLGDQANYIYNSEHPSVKHLLGSYYKQIYKIPLIKYYGYFEVYTKYYINNKMNLTKFTNKGASIEKNHLPKQKFDELIKQRLAFEWEFKNDPTLLSEYLDLINKNKSRKFIFVVAPYHNSCFAKFKNHKDSESFLKYLDSIENVEVFDFSKAEFPDNCFMNTTHLNLEGVTRYNRALKDSLNKILLNN